MDPEYIKDEIDRMFSDVSVSVNETRERLEAIAAHIAMLIESLPEEERTI